MPIPVIDQPMMTAPGEAWRDISLGRLKTPPPIMEPTTRATNGISVSLEPRSASVCIVSVIAAIISSKCCLHPSDHTDRPLHTRVGDVGPGHPDAPLIHRRRVQ